MLSEKLIPYTYWSATFTSDTYCHSCLYPRSKQCQSSGVYMFVRSSIGSHIVVAKQILVYCLCTFMLSIIFHPQLFPYSMQCDVLKHNAHQKKETRTPSLFAHGSPDHQDLIKWAVYPCSKVQRISITINRHDILSSSLLFNKPLGIEWHSYAWDYIFAKINDRSWWAPCTKMALSRTKPNFWSLWCSRAPFFHHTFVICRRAKRRKRWYNTIVQREPPSMMYILRALVWNDDHLLYHVWLFVMQQRLVASFLIIPRGALYPFGDKKKSCVSIR